MTNPAPIMIKAVEPSGNKTSNSITSGNKATQKGILGALNVSVKKVTKTDDKQANLSFSQHLESNGIAVPTVKQSTEKSTPKKPAGTKIIAQKTGKTTTGSKGKSKGITVTSNGQAKNLAGKVKVGGKAVTQIIKGMIPKNIVKRSSAGIPTVVKGKTPTIQVKPSVVLPNIPGNLPGTDLAGTLKQSAPPKGKAIDNNPVQMKQWTQTPKVENPVSNLSQKEVIETPTEFGKSKSTAPQIQSAKIHFKPEVKQTVQTTKVVDHTTPEVKTRSMQTNSEHLYPNTKIPSVDQQAIEAKPQQNVNPKPIADEPTKNETRASIQQDSEKTVEQPASKIFSGEKPIHSENIQDVKQNPVSQEPSVSKPKTASSNQFSDSKSDQKSPPTQNQISENNAPIKEAQPNTTEEPIVPKSPGENFNAAKIQKQTIITENPIQFTNQVTVSIPNKPVLNISEKTVKTKVSQKIASEEMESQPKQKVESNESTQKVAQPTETKTTEKAVPEPVSKTSLHTKPSETADLHPVPKFDFWIHTLTKQLQSDTAARQTVMIRKISHWIEIADAKQKSPSHLTIQDAEVGKVDIDYANKLDGKQITISVENEATRNHLQRLIPVVVESLHHKGFSQIDVQVHLKQDSDLKQELYQQSRNHQRDDRQSRPNSGMNRNHVDIPLQAERVKNYGYNTMEMIA